MSRTIQERIQHIQNLELDLDGRDSQDPGAASRALFVTDNQDQDSAAVAGSCAVSFVGDLSGQMKADVLNSTLLAQLASNKKFDRRTEIEKWYDSYKTILENIGWNVQAFDFAQMSDANSYLSVDKLLLELAQAFLSSKELALFTTMVESLQNSANQGASELFNHSSKDVDRASFQAGVVSNAQGNALFNIGCYRYGAHRDIDTVLFFHFGDQSVDFFAGNQSMILNNDVYAQVRQTILEKLGQNAQSFVHGIDI